MQNTVLALIDQIVRLFHEFVAAIGGSLPPIVWVLGLLGFLAYYLVTTSLNRR